MRRATIGLKSFVDNFRMSSALRCATEAVRCGSASLDIPESTERLRVLTTVCSSLPSSTFGSLRERWEIRATSGSTGSTRPERFNAAYLTGSKATRSWGTVVVLESVKGAGGGGGGAVVSSGDGRALKNGGCQEGVGMMTVSSGGGGGGGIIRS